MGQVIGQLSGFPELAAVQFLPHSDQKPSPLVVLSEEVPTDLQAAGRIEVEGAGEKLFHFVDGLGGNPLGKLAEIPKAKSNHLTEFHPPTTWLIFSRLVTTFFPATDTCRKNVVTRRLAIFSMANKS